MNIWLIIMWTWLFLGFCASCYYLLADPPDDRGPKEIIIFIVITAIGPFAIYMMFKDITILIKQKISQQNEENEINN